VGTANPLTGQMPPGLLAEHSQETLIHAEKLTMA